MLHDQGKACEIKQKKKDLRGEATHFLVVQLVDSTCRAVPLRD